MRRLLLLILICWPFLFSGTICNVVVGGVAAPSGTYYYRGGTSDPYTTRQSQIAYVGWRAGDHWTPGVTKSITKIGVKLDGVSSAVTVALWTISGSTWTFQRCATIASPTTGWNDATITSYSLSDSTQIGITVIFSDDEYSNNWYYASDTGGYLSSGNTYANECSSTTISSADDYQYGVRFYGE